MKRISIGLIISMLVCSYPWQLTGHNNFRNILKHDVSVIVPGIGAEGVMLGENIDTLISISDYKDYQISKPRKKKDLFKDVLKVTYNNQIIFDYIYFFTKEKFFLFVLKRKVVSIVGLRADRITIDSISLDRGVDFFLYNYGNENCKKIKSGDSRLIIYSKIGLAIIDDKSDNTINMYLIFKKY